MRPLLLPGLLDAARHNARARARRAGAVRVARTLPALRRRSTRRPRVAARRAARPRAPPPRRCSRRAAPAGWRTRASPPTSTRPGAGGGALLRDGRRAVVGRGAGERPFLHPGRPASVIAGGDGEELGWHRRAPPAGGARLGAGGPVAAFELDVDALAELAPARSETAIATSRASPPCSRTSPWWWPTTCPPAEVDGGGARRRRRAARGAPRVRPLPRRAGGGGPQVARAAARVPRARPHAHRRRGGRAARGDRARARGRSGGSLRA